MKDSLMQQCLDMLKKEDVKMLFKPVIDFILIEINPYIYAIIVMVFIIFIMLLAILFILISLLRNKQLLNKFI
jgi:hypothetical protein